MDTRLEKLVGVGCGFKSSFATFYTADNLPISKFDNSTSILMTIIYFIIKCPCHEKVDGLTGMLMKEHVPFIYY